MPADTRPSVRRQLLLTLGGVFLVGMLVLLAAARTYGRWAADLSYDHLLKSSALSIADSVSLLQGRWQVDLPYAALDLLAMAPDDRVVYRVLAPDGSLVTGYADLPAPPPSRGGQRDEAVFFDAPYRGETLRFVVMGRWAASAIDQGRALVQVGQTRLARDALMADIVWRAVAAIAVLTGVALLLLWFAVHRALRPLARIEQELRGRDTAELLPLNSPVPQELAQLVGSLNHFMARLSANFDALRTFIAEAAHQMRTPLAALRAQAQLALDEDDPDEQKHSLVVIERNASRLTRLLNQLLADASVLHRGNLHHFAPVDMVALVNEAIHDTVPQADPRPDVRFDSQVPQASLPGDALMLREAVKNLVDNALLHGRPEAGTIHLRLLAEVRHWCLQVSDHGPGIAAAEALTVFERFVRGKGAGPGGAGLGLAIVQRVVLSHGGSIDLSNRREGGLVVSLRFPRDPAAANPSPPIQR